CGEHLTLADIQFGHVLYRYVDAGLAQREVPGVDAYYQRLTTRPAYRRTVMGSYDALKETVGGEEGAS
ncbi:MAG: glutathione S-transferase, partial [Arenibacterium sp.]